LTKKEVLLENAQRLYVIEQMTIDEVAQKVDVNERTIRRWKTEHNWDLRKEQYVKTKQMFHEELYNFARKLMVSIEYDMDNNEKVDPGRMFAFTKMLPLNYKIKEYEDDVSKKETEDTGSKELSLSL
jgi:transposase